MKGLKNEINKPTYDMKKKAKECQITANIL